MTTAGATKFHCFREGRMTGPYTASPKIYKINERKKINFIQPGSFQLKRQKSV